MASPPYVCGLLYRDAKLYSHVCTRKRGHYGSCGRGIDDDRIDPLYTDMLRKIVKMVGRQRVLDFVFNLKE